MISYPTIASSFHFISHAQSFTYNAPTTPIDRLASEANQGLFSATTSVDFPDSTPTEDSLMSRPLSINQLTSQPTSPISTTAIARPDANTQSTNPTTGGLGEMSTGVKVGVIIGITVVVILSLIAVGFCCLDGRRRIQRWKEKRQEKKDAELLMWETELRNGQLGRHDAKPKGLWDDLKVNLDTKESQSDQRCATNDPILEEYERRLRSVGMWKRVGETRSEVRRSKNEYEVKKEMVMANRPPERDLEHSPPCIPRDRVSIVSSIGSLGMPVVGPPVVARNFLDKDDRR